MEGRNISNFNSIALNRRPTLQIENASAIATRPEHVQQPVRYFMDDINSLTGRPNGIKVPSTACLRPCSVLLLRLPPLKIMRSDVAMSQQLRLPNSCPAVKLEPIPENTTSGSVPEEMLDTMKFKQETGYTGLLNSAFSSESNIISQDAKLQEVTDFTSVVSANHHVQDNKEVFIGPISCTNKFNNSDKKLFKCDICSRQLTSKDTLQRHLARHMQHAENPRWKCTYCGRICYSKHHLRVHEISHTGNKPFKCTTCDKAFSTKYSLKLHEYSHSDVAHFACPLCDKKLKRPAALYTHLKKHSGIRNHVCGECGKRYMTRKDLKRHTYSHTGERPFPCLKCDKKFGTRDKLQIHEGLHTDVRLYKCDECWKSFYLEITLKQHKRRVHATRKLYECSVCGAQFRTALQCKEHFLSHESSTLSREPTYKCDICNQMFRFGSSLLNHKRSRHPHVLLDCKKCGRLFDSLSHLTDHMNFRCTGTSVRQKKSEERHDCTLCDKNFSTIFFLHRHMDSVHKNINNQEKPYKCIFCSSKFPNRRSRRIHIDRHTTDAMLHAYNCDFCGKRLVSKRIFLWHRRQHVLRHQFLCQICGIFFNNRKVATEHVKEEH